MDAFVYKEFIHHLTINKNKLYKKTAVSMGLLWLRFVGVLGGMFVVSVVGIL